MHGTVEDSRKFHFISFDFLSLHFKDEVKKLQCERHYEVHGAKEEKKFHCNSCNKIFMTKGNLEQHLSVHSNIKPFACQFSCGTAFKSNGCRKRHEFSCVFNKNRKLHLCPICKREFTFQSSLKKHYVTIHRASEDKKFKCQLCGKGFNFKDRLKTHSLVHASGVKPFTCKFSCGATFKYIHSKKKHENNRTCR